MFPAVTNKISSIIMNEVFETGKVSHPVNQSIANELDENKSN